MTAPEDQPLLRRTLARMDEAWAAFRDRAQAIPAERLGTRIGEDGWTRKQMLGHVTTWHELTVDRLSRFGETGEPADLPDPTDAINARAARAADGRTAGEVLMAIDDSFRRLRRAVARLSDDQLAANDGWAAAVIAGNTFDHYAEHLADIGR